MNGEKGGGGGEYGVREGDRKGADFDGEEGEGADEDDGSVRGSPVDVKRREGLFMPHHTLCAATYFFSRFPLYDNTVIPYWSDRFTI